ncbi:ERP29 [Symbiodinium necroappetens]|uniref:ERP29 protein n=1 Tax=Symbiodinium necroappetens TaxID=1628268 RepID=A0A813BRE8_9DINO|nr:ERP29 [Symbiodinium necroappetens]
MWRLVVIWALPAVAADYNVINLDNATFPLLVGRRGWPPVLVRFDREYPFGEKADAFKAVAAVVAKSSSSTLMASVGISTYGEKQNQDVARRFGLIPEDKEELQNSDMDKLFPKILYFKPGDLEGQLYNGKVTKAGLLKFLGIEEKTCDVLTGEFCNEEQKRQLTSLSGKSPEELGKLLETLTKRSAQTLKKEERKEVDGQLAVLKKVLKAQKKAKKQKPPWADFAPWRVLQRGTLRFAHNRLKRGAFRAAMEEPQQAPRRSLLQTSC